MVKRLILAFLVSLGVSGLSLLNKISVLCDAGSFEVHENACKAGDVLYIARGFPLAFQMKPDPMTVLSFLTNAFVYFAIIFIILILTKQIDLFK